MDHLDIETKVLALQANTVSGEEEAWEMLKPLGVVVVPYLLAAYPKFKRMNGRLSLVYHSIKYARVSKEAFELGVAALKDKSKLVRYRACMLLAYSQNDEALPFLREESETKCSETH